MIRINHGDCNNRNLIIGKVFSHRFWVTSASSTKPTVGEVDALQAEIDGLRQARDNIFKLPFNEWVDAKLWELNEVLILNTTDSALVLRKLLGPMNLEAQYSDIGKPYYVHIRNHRTIAQ